MLEDSLHLLGWTMGWVSSNKVIRAIALADSISFEQLATGWVSPPERQQAVLRQDVGPGTLRGGEKAR